MSVQRPCSVQDLHTVLYGCFCTLKWHNSIVWNGCFFSKWKTATDCEWEKIKLHTQISLSLSLSLCAKADYFLSQIPYAYMIFAYWIWFLYGHPQIEYTTTLVKCCKSSVDSLMLYCLFFHFCLHFYCSTPSIIFGGRVAFFTLLFIN